jgi:flagellar protein FlgJ
MTAPVNKAGFYADFGSLSALKRDAKVDSQKTLRAAAQQFESLFTDMMLKSMRQASIGDSMTGSDTVDMYQGMFDQQLSLQMSKGRGIGLADMLVQQLSRTGLSKPTASTMGVTETDSAQAPAVNGVATPVTTPAPVAAGEASATNESNEVGTAVSDVQSANWPPATPEEFVQQLLPHARAAAQQLGVDPATLVAHAALETGWGKHMPTNADGSTSFNLFGIKASKSWQGQSAGAATLEYEQGVAVKRVAQFRSYDSPADCFGDYAKLLSGSSRYSAARNSGDNTHQFAQSLQQGGYATDPLYANKLRAVAGVVRAIQTAPAQASTQVVAMAAAT